MSMGNKNVISFLDKALEWALYILIFSIAFSNTLIEICAITAILCWVAKKLLLGKSGFKLAYTELNLPLSVFYAIAFLSIFWSTNPDISLRAFLRKLTEYLALYFVVVETVREKRVAYNMLKALGISLLVICLDGIYQKFVLFDFIRNYKLFSLRSMTGPFKFPNGLSAWLLIASSPFISLALFYPLKRGESDIEPLRLKAEASILAILALYCLYATYTRGAIMSFAACLFLMLLLRGTKVTYIICAVFVIGFIVLSLVLPVPEGAHRYHGLRYYIGMSDLIDGITSKHRLRMWTAGWRMFMDRPLIGQGFNTFMANYARFKVPDQTMGLWYAHNCYLQFAAEIGVFGALSFLWMIWRMVINSLRSYRLMRDGLLKFAFLGLFCGIAAYLLQAAVETSLYSLRLAVLFYFSLGLLMGIKRLGYGKV